MAQIEKVRYTHDAMIDIIIAHPAISQGELARAFGFTEPWVSQVINSDAFRERLAERKNELVDPRLRMTIEERLRGLADTSLQILLEKLQETKSMNVAVRALDVATRGLGLGMTKPVQVNVNSYVAMIPQRENSAQSWAAGYAPVPAPVDVVPVEK